MDCKKANDLMMKYMDMTMTEKEANALKEHIGKCAECYEDFLTYNEILEGFSDNSDNIAAPEGFEACVMEKIYGLGEIYKEKENSFYPFFYGIWCVISMLCGFGMLLILNKEAIMNYLSSNAMLSGYVKYFEAIESYGLQFKANILNLLDMLLSSIGGYISNIQFVAVVALFILISAQIIIFRKNKVEV